jgi:hypothetical protein
MAHAKAQRRKEKGEIIRIAGRQEDSGTFSSLLPVFIMVLLCDFAPLREPSAKLAKRKNVHVGNVGIR